VRAREGRSEEVREGEEVRERGMAGEGGGRCQPQDAPTPRHIHQPATSSQNGKGSQEGEARTHARKHASTHERTHARTHANVRKRERSRTRTGGVELGWGGRGKGGRAGRGSGEAREGGRAGVSEGRSKRGREEGQQEQHWQGKPRRGSVDASERRGLSRTAKGGEGGNNARGRCQGEGLRMGRRGRRKGDEKQLGEWEGGERE
jgi:hypothetical protein